jgi:hypothetical protein
MAHPDSPHLCVRRRAWPRRGTVMFRAGGLVAVMAACMLAALMFGAGTAAAAPRASAADTALAEKYAPVMRFKQRAVPCDGGEAYRPLNVSVLMGNDLVSLRGPWALQPVVAVAPSARRLSTGLAGYSLDFPGDALDPGCDYEALAAKVQATTRPTTYAHVATEAGYPGKLALQYWFYYLFNDFTNKHEGDWEMIQLDFDARSAADALRTSPTQVAFSQHDSGERAPWGASKLAVVGATHPVVYPAAGSHANYFRPALYLGRTSQQGFGCDNTTGPSVSSQPVVATIPSVPTTALAAYPWLGFKGHWGEHHGGFYDGPGGPSTQSKWTHPLTWSAHHLRDTSFAVPDGGSAGSTATGFFCNAVTFGSVIYRAATVNPARVAVVFGVLLLVGLWLGSRTRWTPAAPLRIGRRRSWGQVVTSAWRMYSRHALLFMGIGLLFIPVGIAAGALQLMIVRAGTFAAPASGIDQLKATAGVIAMVVGAIVTVLGHALVVAVTSRAVTEVDGTRKVSAWSAYRSSFSSLRPLFGALVILTVVAVALSITVILIPIAIYLIVRWALIAPVIELEHKGPLGALARSARLTRGHLWRVLTLVTGISALALLVGPLVGALVLLVTGASFALVNLLAGLVYVLVLPYAAIVVAYVYYDLRVREEVAGPVPESARILPSELAEMPGADAQAAGGG